SLDSSASRLGRSFAMRVFLRAWARFLPFEDLELKNGQWQAVPTVVRYAARQRLHGLGRTAGFRGPRKNPAARIIFSGDFRKCARPWRDQSPERFSAAVPCKTLRKRTTSSKIRCATSLLLIFGSARSRPSREKSVTIFVSRSNPAPSAVTSLATIKSAFFAESFFRAFSATWSVSAAKPTTIFWPLFRATSASMSAVGSREIVNAASLFLIFSERCSAGR